MLPLCLGVYEFNLIQVFEREEDDGGEEKWEGLDESVVMSQIYALNRRN